MSGPSTSLIPREVEGATRLFNEKNETLGWGIWVWVGNTYSMVALDPTLSRRLPSTFISAEASFG